MTAVLSHFTFSTKKCYNSTVCPQQRSFFLVSTNLHFQSFYNNMDIVEVIVYVCIRYSPQSFLLTAAFSCYFFMTGCGTLNWGYLCIHGLAPTNNGQRMIVAEQKPKKVKISTPKLL